MTDRTDHRAKAERMLADAHEWGQQGEEPTPEVGELGCLAYAAVHALFAVHDALTTADPTPEPATVTHPWQNPLIVTHPWPSTLPGVVADDRYDVNETKQREEAQPDPLDDASIEEVLVLAAKASRRWARTLELLKQAEEEEREQQREEAKPDPLDENDHRDRLDRDGDRITWRGVRHWHYAWDVECACYTLSPSPLADFGNDYGPLTFAPDAA